MVSVLPTKCPEILFSSFRGVALTSCFSSKFLKMSKLGNFDRLNFVGIVPL
jgi:hypothetical protein